MSPLSGVKVELVDLNVTVAGRPLLQRASAEFEAGEITLIIGPSGAGKSVLLKLLAGLVDGEQPAIDVSGEMSFWDARGRRLPRRPPVGVVFQQFALFDEFSPLDNARFARGHRPRAAAGVAPPAPEELAALEPRALLAELEVPHATPTAALSGGQKQRLALARALAYNPELMLYDEPTSGLDAATAEKVAALIQRTHHRHRKTSIIVTHDYESLPPIAHAIYLFNPETKSLELIDPADHLELREALRREPPARAPADAASPAAWRGAALGVLNTTGDLFAGLCRAAEETALLPWRLVPWWKNPWWGLRLLGHYLWLIAGPSAWLYLLTAGVIVGFVTTYFTFEYLPYARFTEPVLIENLLFSIGFALYRILSPVLATVLIAARCGAAAASDVGGKKYNHQLDALRTLGARPANYLLTNILWAFLLGTPLLAAVCYWAASTTSLAVFTFMYPERGPAFWSAHFHSELHAADAWFFAGAAWLHGKLLVCGAGVALIAYFLGAAPKRSTRDVSGGITGTILWATLYVLVAHFVFAFFEF